MLIFLYQGESKNSRGITTILVPNFEYKILSFLPDKFGRFSFLSIELEGKFVLTIINIYVPNVDDPY